jgi:site-specific recombinase XerD
MSDRLPVRSEPRLVVESARDVDLLRAYLERFERPNTRRNYYNDISQFFGGAESVTTSMVQDVSFMDVNHHLTELESSGCKPSTIKRRVAALRGFFDWLRALEVIDRNPTERSLLRRIRSTATRDRRIVFLSPEQARRLLEAAASTPSGDRDRALVLTMLYCVLRRSEAAAMDVEHIRPLGRYWVLDLPDTKGGTDQYVKIPEHVVEAIDDMRSVNGISSGALWRSMSNNSKGRRLSARSIYSIVHAAAVAAGLSEDVGAHTLRHTGCTLAIESGASVHQVQTHARHKKIETTMVYVHQRDRLRDSAADFIRLDDGPEE